MRGVFQAMMYFLPETGRPSAGPFNMAGQTAFIKRDHAAPNGRMAESLAIGTHPPVPRMIRMDAPHPRP